MMPPTPSRQKLSIADAWDEANAFLRAELALVAPVALAFIALPVAAAELAAPTSARTVANAGLLIVLGLASGVVQLFGCVAIMILALKPGLSVAEALRAALRRIGSSLGLAGLVFGAGILLSIPVAPYLPSPGNAKPPAPPAAITLYTVVLLLGLAVILIRLALAGAAVAAEAIGPIAAMRRSLALTRGVSLRLGGFLVMFMLFWIIVRLATDAGLGSLLLMIGRITGAVAIAKALSALVSAMVQAGLAAWFIVILAKIYARLSGWASSGI